MKKYRDHDWLRCRARSSSLLADAQVVKRSQGQSECICFAIPHCAEKALGLHARIRHVESAMGDASVAVNFRFRTPPSLACISFECENHRTRASMSGL